MFNLIDTCRQSAHIDRDCKVQGNQVHHDGKKKERNLFLEYLHFRYHILALINLPLFSFIRRYFQ